jgi:hypothetical protein
MFSPAGLPEIFRLSLIRSRSLYPVLVNSISMVGSTKENRETTGIWQTKNGSVETEMSAR